jgi:predicted transcriptional regulator YdeE
MTEITAHDRMTITGLPLRTSNDVAAETIPPHWGAFSARGGVQQVPARLDDEVFAVYTGFAHEGVDNSGDYTLVIGCRVPDGSPTPPGLATVVVPASHRVAFAVEPGRPDLVGRAWREIWTRDDLAKTFVADVERYSLDGNIEISIGVAAPQ